MLFIYLTHSYVINEHLINRQPIRYDMSEDQTMSAEEFQNQYNFDADNFAIDDLESDDHSQFANLHAELEEARQELVSIRDFIRFAVTQLRCSRSTRNDRRIC